MIIIILTGNNDHEIKNLPLEDNNKAIKQAWIDAMQSNKEKDELIKNLQKEVIFCFTSFHLFEIYLS